MHVSHPLPIQLHSLKGSGGLHRSWTTTFETGLLHEYYIPTGAPVIEANSTQWSSPYPVVASFYPGQYFQVFMLCKTDCTEYYCNIVTPFIKTNTSLYFIDLDIDVVVTDDGVKVIDLEEFEQRKESYPQEWIENASRATEQLVHRAERRLGVFSLKNQKQWRALISSQNRHL